MKLKILNYNYAEDANKDSISDGYQELRSLNQPETNIEIQISGQNADDVQKLIK
jgi:hypothetical protein